MLSFHHTVKKAPRDKQETFLFLKEKILGKKYELECVFIGTTRAKTLNLTYRNKSYTPNILSFPIDDQTGTIFLCLPILKIQAKKEGMPLADYIRFLFIHGCLHLKGLDHGDEMERQEDRYFKLSA